MVIAINGTMDIHIGHGARTWVLRDSFREESQSPVLRITCVGNISVATIAGDFVSRSHSSPPLLQVRHKPLAQTSVQRADAVGFLQVALGVVLVALLHAHEFVEDLVWVCCLLEGAWFVHGTVLSDSSPHRKADVAALFQRWDDFTFRCNCQSRLGSVDGYARAVQVNTSRQTDKTELCLALGALDVNVEHVPLNRTAFFGGHSSDITETLKLFVLATHCVPATISSNFCLIMSNRALSMSSTLSRAINISALVTA